MLKVYALGSMTAAVAAEASASLRDGGLACLPTDTIYGLACLPAHAGAVERLYEVKGRDRDKPLAAVLGSLGDLDRLSPDLDPAVRAAAATLLPGAVTVVIAAYGKEDTALSAALGSPGSLGIRILPPPLDGIYARLPVPLALTSANLSGRADPCSLDEVAPEVLDVCDFAIDAGPCALTVPSTVVDLRPLAAGEPAAVIREGAVSAEEIRQKLSAVIRKK